MQLDISKSSLKAYKALASEVRLQIIQMLSQKRMSVKELAGSLGLSSTIVLMHLEKLADAGIIAFEKIGHQKFSRLKVDHISIKFPRKIYPSFAVHETSIPVGHYTNFSIKPSCGLAGKHDYIGKVDNPKYFMDPDRMNAGMIWFCKGFVEYQTPNFLTDNEHLEMLDLSMELGSEFPFSNNVWPSDITFYINGVEIGTWTSSGDFSDIRGKYTPSWVPDNVNQYGVLKILRITDHGTYLDGQPFTPVSLDALDTNRETWTIRFAVKKDAVHQGGCTIFGKGFGNHDQDINLQLFYS
ncbi:MAG: ArsR family transcriptional regulator [Sporolactobacillus sp.]|jgi:predicted transcriptional regulator|nr:ArsR family transcriptional regulator [Sporolactobacillus sp.]MCI1882315.1 ArsR family transcriptional regulator [Sporolactobacillus sp.]